MPKAKSKKIEKLNLESIRGNFEEIQNKINELVDAYNGASKKDNDE